MNVQSARPGIVGPLRNLKVQKPVWHGNKNTEEREAKYPLRAAPGDGVDTVVQRSAPGPKVPAPIITFEGVDNRNGVLPPDTNGDVGPNHYMQWVNLSYAVYNKTTGALVLGPLNGNTLFSDAARTPNCAQFNSGDPVVLYDQHAGRWLASQFTGNNYMCIAISTTNDPTGTWCTYEYLPNPAEFPDYPKFGVWPSQNAYMMVATQFSNTFDGFAVVGYERDKMLACQTARMLYKNMFTVDPYLPYILPADADGATLPPANAPAPILAMNFDGTGLDPDQLQVWNATLDWTAQTIDVAYERSLQAAAFDSNLCDYARGCIRQPGTSVRLDTLADRLMHRVAVPQLRRLADARREPLGRHGRRPRRRALVPDREGRRRQLGPQGPGDVRAGRRRPLDAEHRDGQERQPRARLLGGQRHGEHVSECPLHRPARHRSARHRCRQKRRSWPAAGRRPIPPAAGATTR